MPAPTLNFIPTTKFNMMHIFICTYVYEYPLNEEEHNIHKK